MLVSDNSCDVLAYNKRLSDVTLMIWPPQALESLIIVYNKFLITMIGDVGARADQITNVTPNDRLL